MENMIQPVERPALPGEREVLLRELRGVIRDAHPVTQIRALEALEQDRFDVRIRRGGLVDFFDRDSELAIFANNSWSKCVAILEHDESEWLRHP